MPGSEPTVADARTTGPGRSLAVLYFENLSSDPESEYFCSGITEDLLADLGNLEGLRVASRSAVLRYRGTAFDIRRVGAELGVAAVLVGSVRRAGNRIRIAAELVSTIDGFQLWAQRYDRSIEDIFAVQDDMARTISEALRGVVTPTEAAVLQRGRPESAEAYDLYLRARELYGNFTREENLRALECLERAVERNPRYALAWAGIADCCGQMYNKLWEAEERWLTRGLEAAARAVELGPDLPETHKSLALNLSNRGDAPGAIAALRKALAINPRFQPALHNLGVELMQAGDFAGSERAYRRAIAVDSARWIAHIELAWLLICTRRYADALLEGNRGLRFSTRPWHRMSAHAIKIVALAYEGDFAAAGGELRAARATELEGTTLVTAEAFLAAASGRHERAREILAGLAGQPHLFMSEAWVRPETAALLGDFESALRDLRELDQPHFVTKWPSLRILPGLSRLRDTPEFQAWLGGRGRRIVWPLESPPLPAADRAQFTEYAEASGIPSGDSMP
jgi:TolB-like protein/Tfp pilus assembly protein PilF